MPDAKFDLLGPALAAIGREAMNIIGGEPSGVFLYAEIGDSWVEPSLFKDEGQSLRYVDIGTSRIDLLITDAWCLEPDSKRWTAMRYSIEHGKFLTQFDYDNIEHSDEDGLDRRDRVLRERFGDKPVVYPPLPHDGWEVKPPA